MIYHETSSGKLHQGEVLDILHTLPDESVNCCVTSPPYWGLRDYGTAEWVGGDAECDHKHHYARNDGGRENVNGFHGSSSADSNKGAINYKDTCPKCGAVRKDRQLGLERTPEEYVARMVEIFREVRRVLTKDGTLWLNLGDSYASNGCYLHTWMDKHPEKKHLHTKNSERYKDVPAFRGGEYSIKPKDLVGIPWRVAFALQADGWYLRQDLIWHKPNPMPESVTDRCTKAHEYVFLMSKSAKYYYDNEAVKEQAVAPDSIHVHKDGNKMSDVSDDPLYATKPQRTMGGYEKRNKRSVWTVTTKPFKEAHFATFPRDLIRPMIQAGCPADGVVLDPFMGSGTTAIEAIYQGKRYIGIDLNPDYCAMAAKRIDAELEQTTIFEEEETNDHD
jgi:DNA modification methylase